MYENKMCQLNGQPRGWCHMVSSLEKLLVVISDNWFTNLTLTHAQLCLVETQVLAP